MQELDTCLDSFLDFQQRDVLQGVRCLSNAENRILAAEVGGNDL